MRLSRWENIVYEEELLGKFHVFKDRFEAGRLLGEASRTIVKSADYVLAIPMGGIPIGLEVSKSLNSKFDVIICRKLLIPWNREAGFGAVDPDGEYFIDEDFSRSMGLSSSDINEAVREQVEEVRKRNYLLRKGKEYPSYDGLKIVLVDDGIAAGYTMTAAIKFVKSRGAKEVIKAVPTGCLESLVKLSRCVDLIVCLNVRTGPWFAVADAFVDWRDLNYEDVIKMLNSYEGKFESL
ncbi:MAG: phosphoribosyltransferase family protein [Candidatus Nezhaarchaeales archaeon]